MRVSVCVWLGEQADGRGEVTVLMRSRCARAWHAALREWAAAALESGVERAREHVTTTVHWKVGRY